MADFILTTRRGISARPRAKLEPWRPAAGRGASDGSRACALTAGTRAPTIDRDNVGRHARATTGGPTDGAAGGDRVRGGPPMNGEERALALDAQDELAGFRERFYLPLDTIYLDGNSLGPPSREAEGALLQVLDEWKRLAIGGSSRGRRPGSPWESAWASCRLRSWAPIPTR